MDEPAKITLLLETYLRTMSTLERQASEIYELKDSLMTMRDEFLLFKQQVEEKDKPKPNRRRKKDEGTAS